jgi:hypothetical protein
MNFRWDRAEGIHPEKYHGELQPGNGNHPLLPRRATAFTLTVMKKIKKILN